MILDIKNFGVDVARVEKGAKLTFNLPEIFYRSYVDIPAPRSTKIAYDTNVISKIKNGVVEFRTDKTGYRDVTVINYDSNSPFYGSTAYYNYYVDDKSTKPNDKDKGYNNDFDKTPPSYQPPVIMTLKAKASTSGGFAKYKNIEIKLSGEHVTPSNATIYVDNKKVANNNGTGVYKATKNGKYTIVVKYPGISDIVFSLKVDKIDSKKPSYTYTTTMNPGSNVKHLTIVAEDKDQYPIKEISVNGKSLYTCDNKTMYYRKVVNYKVTKTGNYKIKVTDMAGNVYEKTEKINIDTTYPQFNKVTVVKENNVNYDGNTTDSKVCRVKVGDTVIIKMEAHENVARYGAIYLNDKYYNKTVPTIEGKTLTLKIALSQDLVDSYKLNGYIKIEVLGVKDKWGNVGNYENGKLLYLDKVAPEIKQVTITGGTLSKNKEAIEIYKNQEITISVITSERLANRPAISIGNFIAWAKFEDNVKLNEQLLSKYSVTLKTNNLIKSFKASAIENSVIPIYISGYKDITGNTGKTVTINEKNKSSNGVCLVYGKIPTGTIYFVGTQKVRDAVVGDINFDGYINEYDYLLLTRHLSQVEELSEEQKLYANIDGKDSIDKKDLVELNNLIDKQENTLFKNTSATFKIYDEDNKQLSGQNLEFTIEEGKELATLTKVEDSVTIKANDVDGKVVVKASCVDETGYGEKTGKIDMVIGTAERGTGSFDVVSENKTNRIIMGDVNQDGFITVLDARMIQMYGVGLIELTEEQKEIANVVDDGRVNVIDATAIQKLSYNNYNGMKAGDKVILKFNSQSNGTYVDFKDDLIQNQIVWKTKENTDDITIIPNTNDGSAEIKINDNAEAGTRITVICTAIISEGYTEIAEFNIEIIDKAEVEITNKEIIYDLSKLEENNIVLRAATNLSNRKIMWDFKSDEEGIIKLEVDKYGNAEVIPLKSGVAVVYATVDGVSETCKVTVIETIKEIIVNKQSIEIKETEEEEIEVNVNPSTATEIPVMTSVDENIAKVYEDKETGTYKVVAIEEGSTKIIVSSPSDSEINQEIEVNVKKLITPALKTITIDQDEEEKTYKPGDKINIKFEFTDTVIGEAPKLNLMFGEYKSIGEPEFIRFEDNNTSILYQYSIQEGDNGILSIKNLEDGNLTDDTGKVKANLIVDLIDYEEKEDEELEIQDDEEETTEATISNEEELDVATLNMDIKNYQKNVVLVKAATSQNDELDSEDAEEDIEEGEIVSDGIYRTLSAVNTDSVKPTITISSDVDKNSCWLKEGDIAKVKIIASEELKGTPIVTMGGIEATVEGSGTEYTASLPVTKELEEGYLEIKVRGYQDLAGNEGEEVIAQEENMDEPIIIDYSGTKIKSIELIKEEGKKYDVGDQFKIRVVFKDATIDRNEYITSLEMPKINIKFGQNQAQGNLESDYKTDEYEDSIIYTYTISEKDNGKISINGLLGTIQDVAGNITVLDNLEDFPEVTTTYIKDTSEDNSQPEEENKDSDSKEENNDKDNTKPDNKEEEKEENTNTDNKDDKKYFGKLPYAGASSVMIGLVTSVMAGMIVVYVVKKKHLRIRIKFK